MNLSENEIESLLRRAPTPPPPTSLSSSLLRDFKRPPRSATDPRNHREIAQRTPSGRWKRWLPFLFPAAITAAFATALVVQQAQVRTLQRDLRTLQEQVRPTQPAAANPRPSAIELPDPRQEIARLRELAARLSAELAGLEKLETDNKDLRAQIAQHRAQLSPELQVAQEQRDRAQAIMCVNNMKQLGLAARIWATDNQDQFPPNFLSMSNELATPKILVCPSDPSRQPATDWASFTMANVSYEFLSPGPGQFETEPTRIAFRCPIHGNVTLCDGSVQMAVAKNHPDWLAWHNGALYLEVPDQPQAVAGVPGAAAQGLPAEMAARYGLGSAAGSNAGNQAQPPAVGMSPELMKRYGLMPADPAQAEEPVKVQPAPEPQPQP